MSSQYIHPTAIVDEGAILGDHVKVWHWTHVCAGAIIGSGASLGQSVYIAPGVKIGTNVRIQNNVSVYPCVELEAEVFCGPSVVFTNVFNPRAFISRKDQYLPTLVRRGATLGANSTIVCGHTIGSYSFIGAGAVVTADIKPFALVVGVPARQVGWWSAWGERIDLPLVGTGTWFCSHTGDIYNLMGDNMTRVVAKPPTV